MINIEIFYFILKRVYQRIFEKLKLKNLTKLEMRSYLQSMIQDKDWIYKIQMNSDLCIDSVNKWMEKDPNFSKYSKEICNLGYLEYNTCMHLICKFVSIFEYFIILL